MNIKRVIGFAAFCIFGLLSEGSFAAPCTAPHSIKNVRNSSPAGRYEHVIFQIVGSPNLPFVVSAASPPFIADPSGLPVAVKGKKFEKIRFSKVFWTCEIKESFSLPKTAIKDIKKLGQFEGVVEYVVGYGAYSRYLSTRALRSRANWKVVMKFRK